MSPAYGLFRGGSDFCHLLGTYSSAHSRLVDVPGYSQSCLSAFAIEESKAYLYLMFCFWIEQHRQQCRCHTSMEGFGQCRRMFSMELKINGEMRELPNGLTVASLVAHLGMKTDRVAVELNQEIVPRNNWEATLLNNGDQLEIVHFVGGGCATKMPGYRSS